MKMEMLDMEELEQVTGGVTGGASRGGFRFVGRVTPESCVVGRRYYIRKAGVWYYGQLKEIISKSSGGRVLGFDITVQNGYSMYTKLRVDSTQYELYDNMTADV